MKSQSHSRPAWGKTDGAEQNFHHLAHHSADVTAVFEALICQTLFRRRAEQAAGRVLTTGDVARLSAFAFLHDIGKVAPAFQAKGWEDGLWRNPVHGHIDMAFQWVAWANQNMQAALAGGLQEMRGWGDPAPWFMAAFAHHGRPAQRRTIQLNKWPMLAHYNWQAEEALMGRALQKWFAEGFSGTDALPRAPQFLHFFAGLLALSDWVGSDREAFPFVPEFDPGYWHTARERAARRIAEIGLDMQGRSLAGAATFGLVSPHPRPNAAQSKISDVPTDAQLVILEAETGAGKTEAALLRFAKLWEAGEVEGMYFSVPTRAAAQQLHGRVNAALGRMFGANAPEAVLAIPGMLVAGTAQGLKLPPWKVLWDDDAGCAPSRWAAEHATRYLAAAIAVGTVDQAMLSALQVKHAHLRGSALSRSLLVIDEVHASDAYMRHVQKEMLKAHLALSGHALLMSATLGSVARADWRQEPQPDEETARSIPYPTIWVAGETTPRGIAATCQEKAVRVTAHPTMAARAAAQLAIGAAQQGARVLVVRNTVQAAIDIWWKVQDMAPGLLLQVCSGPALHHSRFAAEDRRLLDKAVESVLGKAAGFGAQGCIVIGTQTLEQSLDIDADLLITDLCPMDVLLQRIGRLHRHLRNRPERFATPRTEVLCPEGGLAPLSQRQENGLGAFDNNGTLSGIYVDLAGLEATHRLIKQKPEWRIPAMNRELVEAATHPDALARIADEMLWQAYQRRVTGQALAQAGMAERVILDRSAPFPESYPEDERIKTRIGEEGAVVTISGTPVGPFGQPISRIALPAHWSHGLTGEEAAVAETLEDGLRLTIGEREYRYGRGGLERS